MHIVPPPDDGEDSHGDVVAGQVGDDAARLRSLLDIAQVIGATRRLDELVERSAEAALQALDASGLAISRWDREAGVLRTLVNVGARGPGDARSPADGAHVPDHWPAVVELVERNRAYVTAVDDATPEARLLVHRGMASSLSVPILVEARVWGELWAARDAAAPRFHERDLPFAQAVATQIAAGIVQADHLARIERLAFTDPLTGLANRRAVDERLDLVLARHQADGQVVSIVLADINRLKHVNDTLGHAAGDRLIVSVAQAVSRASGLAQEPLAARIGGDEFCVVLAGQPLAVAVRVAEELCRLVELAPMSTGVSCGVASTEVLSGSVDNAVRLFRLADAAQYRAKRAGSSLPVVAGQSVRDDPGESPADRRGRRGRAGTDVPGALESGLAALDRTADGGPQPRLEVVADHVRDLLDASSWWVSRVLAGSGELVTVSSSVQRSAQPAPGHEPLDPVGQVFDLDAFPVTRAAIARAGSFFLEAGAPGNDPAEEAALVTAGYLAVLGAGASTDSEGWLLEVYADSISLPMGAFEPVLRSLVAVAVAGSGPAGTNTTVPVAREAEPDSVPPLEVHGDR